MRVGDFVGWADSWDDETGLAPAGIILEKRQEVMCEEGYINCNEDNLQFLILYQHNGQIDWEFSSDLEVMFESR